jgi:GT2 family glycosyltransferase
VVDVRLGIVSYNTADLLGQCLDALPAALAGVDAEIVVVDNASRDGSAEVAEARGVRVVRSAENLGYARGMNRALGGSDAPVLVALNPDTLPPPASLATLADRVLADPDLGLVMPRLLNTDGTTQHSAYRFPSPLVALATGLPTAMQRGAIGRRLWLEAAPKPDEPTDVDWGIGAVHVFRADAIVGRPAPYDERWFMYVEDLELCWWLAEHGRRCRLESDVVVPHVGNAAGAAAWGAGRGRRWLRATYDWYARDRGRWAARGWAAANVAAVLSQASQQLVWGLLPGRAEHRRWAREIGAALPVHARAVLTPPTADNSPPGVE